MAGMSGAEGAAAGGGGAGWVGLGLQLAGSILDSQGKKKAGAQFNETSEFAAQQYDIEAGQAVAGAQRQALEQRRKAELTKSRALALAAAGGGAADAGVIDLLADIDGEGNYRALTAMYQGEDKARQYRMGAAARRYEGANAKAAGKTALLPALLRGGATLFSKYGGDGPPSTGKVEGRFDASVGFEDYEMDGQE